MRTLWCLVKTPAVVCNGKKIRMFEVQGIIKALSGFRGGDCCFKIIVGVEDPQNAVLASSIKYDIAARVHLGRLSSLPRSSRHWETRHISTTFNANFNPSRQSHYSRPWLGLHQQSQGLWRDRRDQNYWLQAFCAPVIPLISSEAFSIALFLPSHTISSKTTKGCKNFLMVMSSLRHPTPPTPHSHGHPPQDPGRVLGGPWRVLGGGGSLGEGF